MAIKFRIGNLVVITTDKRQGDSKLGKDDALRAAAAEVEDIGTKIESKVKGWIKNDRIFDGFRNTYARVLLYVLGVATLFGFGYLAFHDEALTGWYGFALVLTVLTQQISVRYVFNSDEDELVDEYQASRRDRAYRIAYKNLQNLVGLAMVLVAANAILPYRFGEDGDWNWVWFENLTFGFDLTLNQASVIFAGVVALMNLQKYWAWGVKGEPFRSKDEPTE
jgi:hypothetical protein